MWHQICERRRHGRTSTITAQKESSLQILMTDEARDHIRDLGRPIALDYLAAIG
jgi:hypothetical protein